MNLYEIAFRNIKRNSRRSLLSMTAIMIAAMSIVMLFSLLAGMKSDMFYNIKSYYTGQVRIRHREYDEHELLNPMHLRIDNYSEVIEELESRSLITNVSPRIFFPGIADPNDQYKSVIGTGIDFRTEPDFQNLEETVTRGRIPKMGTTEIIIGTTLARELGLELGDKITVQTTTMRRGMNAVTFEVVGIASWPVANLNTKTIYAPIDTVQRITRMGNAATELLVKFQKGTPDKEALAIVNDVISSKENLSANLWNKISTMGSFIQIADMMYTVIAFFFFALASTVIINTTMMVIFERMKEIGTIAAMGMKGKEIVRLFFIEAFYLALIGTAAGVVLGIGLTFILGKTGIDYTSSMEGIKIEISSIIYPKLDVRSTIGTFLYSLTVATLASILPTRRAAKIEPVEALRYSG